MNEALAYDHLAMTERELRRLAELDRLDLHASADDEALDRIARIVTLVLDVPMAAVTIVEKDRQWFGVGQGLTVRETPRCDSFCSHVVALDQWVGVADARLDPRFAANPLVTGEPGIRFYLGTPLKTATGTLIGALCAIDRRPREIKEREAVILSELAAMVTDRIELLVVASIDGLTGVLRRTAFLNEAARDFARAARHQQPLGCLMIDVDRFKAINDDHGHAAGDRVLATIGALCRSAIRAGDYVGRIGGEEFCVMLPGATVDAAQRIAERLCGETNQRVRIGPGLPPVTMSVGVAALSPIDGDIAALMARADEALFAAKRAGRNRISVHSQP